MASVAAIFEAATRVRVASTDASASAELPELEMTIKIVRQSNITAFAEAACPRAT